MIGTPEFWVAFSFVVFVILMIKPAKNILLTKLDERALEIKREINETEELKFQAELLLSQCKTKQMSLASELEKINKWAEEEAEALIIESRKKLDEELSRKKKLAEQKLSIAENELIKNSYSNMFTIVIKSVQKYLENNLNNIEIQNSIFESSINSLRNQMHLVNK
ncbi:ATP synthase subunit b precursor [Rickettsiales bacterium Ac37b]|nr:ATP synthase subunit b precursor [Rickettsiales bacterium Ac37b]